MCSFFDASAMITLYCCNWDAFVENISICNWDASICSEYFNSIISFAWLNALFLPRCLFFLTSVKFFLYMLNKFNQNIVFHNTYNPLNGWLNNQSIILRSFDRILSLQWRLPWKKVPTIKFENYQQKCDSRKKIQQKLQWNCHETSKRNILTIYSQWKIAGFF